ncbi:VC0807 family protein [Streptomyces sp. MUSC 14]|uniref:VC0807 family protein n=1 Tax=Streptomyces sp. MUSC 14 TaxID=1354889 RepID=UPI000A7728E1|nr:VC0807 family protein [Streptomyces sp. MUSC 14]
MAYMTRHARQPETGTATDTASEPGTERGTEAATGPPTGPTTGPKPGTRAGGTGYGPLLATAVDIVLPLVVFYAARALGAGQAPALLLSGAPPALRLLYGAVRHRRIDGVDLFFTVLLSAAASVTLLGGGPRVLLFKDAALSLVVGIWVLGTGFTRRPLAFQLGQRLHRGPTARARAGFWEGSAEFRRALRVLTLAWGAEQLLDGGLGTLAAATLPTDTVPLLTRVVSLSLLAVTAVATAAYARRFRTRHGLPLLGAPGDEATGIRTSVAARAGAGQPS